MLLMVRIVKMVVVSMETMTMVTGRMISATFVQHQQVDKRLVSVNSANASLPY